MKKNSATIVLNKWHFKLGMVSTYWDHFGYMIHFGIFKPISFPKPGAMIEKENYKGFWFRKVIRIRGFEISFILPNGEKEKEEGAPIPHSTEK